MTTYLIARINIHDRARYAEYEKGFMDIFHRYNGRLLAVDESTEALEGAWPCTRTVLLSFPSESAARDWYESPAYQALAQHRLAASSADIALVKGLDQT